MATSVKVETKVDDLPPLQFLTRSKVETRTMYGPSSESPKVSPAKVQTPSRAASVFSADGKLMAVAGPDDVQVYNVGTGEVVSTVKLGGVAALAFSPLGSFLITWRRRKESEKNLAIWSLKDTSEQAFGFVHIDMDKKTWPPVEWNAAETLMAGSTINTVTVFSVPEFTRVCKVPCKAVRRISLSPGGAQPLLAVFSPEHKGTPGRVHLYKVPSEADEAPEKLAEKSVFSASRAEFNWAPNSSGLLFQTASDTARDSYYGETQLSYASASGKVVSIPLSKEGPVHNVAWTPNSTQFIAIAGKSPPCATLYNARNCEPCFEFGVGPFNTIRISPHGRFVVFGGFENMAGRMAFWDLYKLKLMGENEVRVAVTSEWSPCGRYFMTTTLFPRLRVDNGYKIFKYNSVGPILHETFDTELYQVTWQPSLPGIYPNRPQSPRTDGSAPVAAPIKREVYRPRGSTGAVARMMAEARGGPKAGKVDKFKTSRPTGLPVGMSVEPDAKSASARRRERRKKNMAEAKSSETTATDKPAEKPVVPPPPVPSALDEKTKEKRKIAKKLRQVEFLLARQAKGETLNEEQLKKVKTVDELREALAKLE